MTNTNALNAPDTAYNVIVGAGPGYAAIAPSAAAYPLVSGGTSSNPSFAELTVPGGGTGAGTLTGILQGHGTSAVTGTTGADNGVLITNNTGAVSWLANSSTAGYVLTANSGAPASWQEAPGATGTVVGFAQTSTTTPQTCSTNIAGASTTPTTTNTTSTISLNYAAASTSNYLVINFTTSGAGTNTSHDTGCFLFQGTTAIASQSININVAGAPIFSFSSQFVVASPPTSSTAYSVGIAAIGSAPIYLLTTDGSTALWGGVCATTLTITEYT